MVYRFASVLSLGAVLLSTAAGQAAPTSYGTYYDETASNFCTNAGCSAYFSQLPSNKLLMVRKVTCLIWTTARLQMAHLMVAQGPNGASPIQRHYQLPLPSAPTPASTGFYFTTMDVEPNWLIGQSRFPYVQVFVVSASDIQIDCTMSGELMDPIQ